MKLHLIQKSKNKWVQDGDENSTFFHALIKIKNRRRNLTGLMVNGMWISDVNFIQNEVVMHYSDKFRETRHERFVIIRDNFKQLFEVDRGFLDAPFELNEVKDAFWNYGEEKALGLDGFTFKFIK